MENNNIYVIILNYNNADDTIECVNSLLFCEEELINEIKILIIDNDSTDDSFLKLKRLYSDKTNIIVIKNDNNLGYASGNNIGIRYAKNDNADYIIILNNDTIIKNNFIISCIKALESDDSLAIVGPVLLEYNKNIIQSAGASIDYFRLNTPLKHCGESFIANDFVEICDYIGGACLIFHSSMIDYLGELPEEYFLFWEETEWCTRLKKFGKKCGCVRNTFIEHKGSSTINHYEGLKNYYMERNRVIFSFRNSGYFIRIISIMRLYLSAIAKGVIYDKKYFNYINYYNDGIKVMLNK